MTIEDLVFEGEEHGDRKVLLQGNLWFMMKDMKYDGRGEY